MMKSLRGKILLLPALLLLALNISAQAPTGYYDSANGLTGKQLQQALHDIIHDHTTLSYTPGLWDAFKTTDKKSDGTVWDMYSDIPSGTPPYTYTFGTDQCGSENGPEGTCYNREHSFPKSWFGGEVYPMYTDLFHIYPTDYYVNNLRGNYPFGEVTSPTTTTKNGSKFGPCSVAGYTGTVFEPIDEYKGDFARTYFYMATCYYGEDGGWPADVSAMVNGSQPKPWALAMLLAWHRADPVSQKEKDRNNAVYGLQHNRNPFIDDPLYVEMVWGTLSSTGDRIADLQGMKLYPNPASSNLTIALPEEESFEKAIQVYDLSGCLVRTITSEELTPEIDVSDLSQGYYLLQVTCRDKRYVSRFVIAR